MAQANSCYPHCCQSWTLTREGHARGKGIWNICSFWARERMIAMRSFTVSLSACLNVSSYPLRRWLAAGVKDDRSSNMGSDLHISQIPAIFHCQFAARSNRQRFMYTYINRKLTIYASGWTRKSQMSFSLLIQPCKMSLSWKPVFLDCVPAVRLTNGRLATPHTLLLTFSPPHFPSSNLTSPWRLSFTLTRPFPPTPQSVISCQAPSCPGSLHLQWHQYAAGYQCYLGPGGSGRDPHVSDVIR